MFLGDSKKTTANIQKDYFSVFTKIGFNYLNCFNGSVITKVNFVYPKLKQKELVVTPYIILLGKNDCSIKIQIDV